MISKDLKKAITGNTKEEFIKKYDVRNVGFEYALVNKEEGSIISCPYEECPRSDNNCDCIECWEDAYQLTICKFKEEN